VLHGQLQAWLHSLQLPTSMTSLVPSHFLIWPSFDSCCVCMHVRFTARLPGYAANEMKSEEKNRLWELAAAVTFLPRRCLATARESTD
jgi:hypothetical protein